MVRLLTAALVEVGHGRMSPQQVRQVLQSGDRSKLPEAAPPHGLYLMQVLYELPEGVEALPRGRRAAGSGSEDGVGDGEEEEEDVEE